MKKTSLIVAGLLIAFVGQFLALGLAGGGHGWNSPFLFSIILWVAYPVVLQRLRLSRDDLSTRVELILLVAAFASDIVLVLMTFNEGLQYLRGFIVTNAMPGFLWMAAWISIWLGWQVVAALNVSRARSAPAEV